MYLLPSSNNDQYMAGLILSLPVDTLLSFQIIFKQVPDNICK